MILSHCSNFMNSHETKTTCRELHYKEVLQHLRVNRDVIASLIDRCRSNKYLLDNKKSLISAILFGVCLVFWSSNFIVSASWCAIALSFLSKIVKKIHFWSNISAQDRKWTNKWKNSFLGKRPKELIKRFSFCLSPSFRNLFSSFFREPTTKMTQFYTDEQLI